MLVIILTITVFQKGNLLKQEHRWKRRKLPKWLLSIIKGRTCNPTPLVNQDMTQITTFYGRNKER